MSPGRLRAARGFFFAVAVIGRAPEACELTLAVACENAHPAPEAQAMCSPQPETGTRFVHLRTSGPIL